MRPVAVVGGGISGLAAAHYLLGHGLVPVVVERRDRLGGVIRTDRFGTCLAEAGPDSWLAEKRRMLGLVDELGLAGEVIGSRDGARRTFVVVDGRLVALPRSMRLLAPANPAELLSTGLFGPIAKARMALEWLRRPMRQPERSVADFVLDHFGEQALERLAQPLLAGVYGAAPEELSADFVIPRFVEYERRHGSILRGVFKNRGRGPRRSLFQTLRGGMESLVAALRRRLDPSCRFVRGEVRSLRWDRDSWLLGLAGGEIEASAVILAIPACDAAPILRSLDPRLAQLVGQIPYKSSVVAGLVYAAGGFEHPLDGFGLLVPRTERASLAACTWVNTKFSDRAGAGKVLLRAFLSGAPAEAALVRKDGATIARAHRELARWMGLAAEPEAARAYRWPRAMPAYRVGHRSLVERIGAVLQGHPGLHLAGNGYDGLGIPDCVRRSRRVASVIAARPGSLRTPSGESP